MPISDKISNKLKPGYSLLLCALVLCSAALVLNSINPRTTYAVAPIPPEKGNATREKLAATPSIWPVNGDITSGYGGRNSPVGNGNESHPGIDIAINTGAPVVATADGQIVQSGPAGGYGNLVQIDHGNGIATLYGHNSKLAVSVGQMVKKGQVIAYAGSTGKSTGPHVHYEVRENDTAADPWIYLVSHKQHG